MSDLPPVYVIGYPGPLGGACTELWHTLKLWRSRGLEVHLVPTWGDPPKEWRDRCGSIGCRTHRSGPKRHELAAVEGLRGAVVVSFCNDAFLHCADLFRELGCRVVWVGCMNWLFPAEQRHYKLFGPFDRYVCQSRHQHRLLSTELSQWGVDPAQVHRIPGAFDPAEFSFRPAAHRDGEPFVIGRVSRAAPSKFSTNTWPILRRVDYPHKRYRIMGWNEAIEKTIGAPPDWAETLPMNAEPVGRFLAGLHCYCQLNGTDTENWPRTGLEAMAAGVPIVVEARGGWTEMIEHGKTGLVCRSDAELAHWIAHLAYDEPFRLDLVYRAWLHLVKHLADPDRIWDGWQKVVQAAAAAEPARRAPESARIERRREKTPAQQEKTPA